MDKGYENATLAGSEGHEDFRRASCIRGGGHLTPIEPWCSRVKPRRMENWLCRGSQWKIKRGQKKC